MRVSNLSQAEREKQPLSIFADPANRKYPILDRSDVRAAVHLIGKAPTGNQAAIKRRIMQRARAIGAASEIPDAWKKDD